MKGRYTVDQSNTSNVKLSEEFFHISFTPTNWLTDPWKCLESAHNWSPIKSETIAKFDTKSFIDKYSRLNTIRPKINNLSAGSTAEKIVEILEDPIFRKGPSGNLLADGKTNLMKIKTAIQNEDPIEIVIPSFAGRPHNPAAHKRVSPDLGEMYALLHLLDISTAVQQVYSPGIKFTLILDGKIYRPFYGYSHDEAMSYEKNLRTQIRDLGASQFIETVDMWDVYENRRGEINAIENDVR